MIDFWEFARALGTKYHVHRKRIMKKFSLTAVEVDVLLFLANKPQYVTAAEVSKVRKIPKSHVSLAVKKLTEKGLLRGAPDGDNRKRICLTITEQADELIFYGRREQQRFMEELFCGFSDGEREMYHALCNRIAENVCVGSEAEEVENNDGQCQ